MKEVILSTKICKHINTISRQKRSPPKLCMGQVCAVHDSKTANPEVTHMSRKALN